MRAEHKHHSISKLFISQVIIRHKSCFFEPIYIREPASSTVTYFILRAYTGTMCQLVSWYFEPSQPQRVTSWLKTMFNLSPIYSARKSSNRKLSINHKISHDTNLYKNKTYTNIGHKIFEELVPSVSPLLKKHKARTRWYCGPFRRFIDTRFFKKYKKRNGQKQSKILKYYINA